MIFFRTYILHKSPAAGLQDFDSLHADHTILLTLTIVYGMDADVEISYPLHNQDECVLSEYYAFVILLDLAKDLAIWVEIVPAAMKYQAPRSTSATYWSTETVRNLYNIGI